MVERLNGDTITSATIITHGFQPIFGGDGDAMMPLANSLLKRIQSEQVVNYVSNRPVSTPWLLDVDVSSEGGTGIFDASPLLSSFVGTPFSGSNLLPTVDLTNERGEVVLLFDWSAASRHDSAGWTEAAGDALFSMLVGLGIAKIDSPSQSAKMHFISHSFGAAVTSEAVERLGKYNISVDHVTYLDPHDFSQGLEFDTEQKQYLLGRGIGGLGYGAQVWNNVSFTDVYFQTRGSSSTFGLAVPEGRPIPGAYNVFLNSQLPTNYADGDVSGTILTCGMDSIEPPSKAIGHSITREQQRYSTAAKQFSID